MARNLSPPVPDSLTLSAAVPARRARRSWRLGPLGFGYLAALADVTAIVTAALATTTIRLPALGGSGHSLQTGFSLGLVVAVLVTLVGLHNGAYAPFRYAEASGQFARAFPVWNTSAVAALTLAVAARVVDDLPRLWLGAFYLVGLAGLVLARRAMTDVYAALNARDLAAPRGVAVLGFEQEIEALDLPEGQTEAGARFVCRFALREADSFFPEDLALAVAAIRLHRPDDVVLALPWSRPDLIDACLEALLKLPAEVHLGLSGPLRRLERAEVAHVGAVAGLTMTRRPLGRLQQLEKRAFDIAVASVALVALSPVFLAVALAIRLESPGPALFRQKRYGLNMEPFRIFKFRSMRVMDDGRHVRQATRADTRVTRLGVWLRRLSIDELPQLLNVLLGDMSIVGPRPHALAHDQIYVEKLARYARRHNVKPGITGWAQVNGHRGEIAHDSAMLARLDHDLYYVDNWSLWLDMKIVFMTVFSRAAHANAY